MAKLAKLIVSLEAESARLTRELEKANRKTASWQKKTQKSVDTVKNAFIGLAGAYGINALKNFAIEQIKVADNIGKTADKLGVTTDALQEYRFAAEQAGVANNVLDMGLQRFTRRVAEAQQGQGELKQALIDSGVELRNSNGTVRSSEAILGDYAEAIKNAESEQERLRLAFKGFDSEGAALVNLFREGAAGVREYREQAQELGIVISEDLLASELRVLNGSTFGGSAIANPSRAGTVYTWTLAGVTLPANSARDLIFDVTYDTALGINEFLAGNNTNIQANVDYTLSCGTTQPTVSNTHLLVLDQPLPQVSKQGRNVDAGQGAGNYTDTVYGHRDDDVIWRVRIQNTGPVDLEDVLLNDAITGNFDINYVCPTEATANSVATGGPPAGCTSTGGGVVEVVNDFLMNDPFGAAGPKDVLAGTFEDIFYVGKIRTLCGVETNAVNIEWRSEERRVGKECRFRWSPYHLKKKSP